MSWEGHQVLVSDLARALLEGRPPMIPGQEARRAVQLVMAIYESAKTGRTVRL
jgi:predicted dehydrogenase